MMLKTMYTETPPKCRLKKKTIIMLGPISLIEKKSRSILRACRPYLKGRRRQRRTIRRNRSRNPQTRQTSPNHARWKIQEGLHPRLTVRIPSQRYIPRRCHELRLQSRIVFLGIETHAAKGFEGVVCEYVDAAMIGFEVVDLFAK
jgi:hypothetical protein